jgi:rhomboid family protein
MGRVARMILLKDDSPSALKPFVTIALIVSCAGVFLWQRSLDTASSRQAVDALGAIPAVLLTDARLPPDLQWVPRFASPFTSMFLHGGWMHLLGNMLFLWIYGDKVEDAMGHARYLAFYFLCGVAAIFVQAFFNPDSPYPIIGASGAISGVLGAYLLLFPRARILTLLLLLWFAVQLISDLAVPGGGASIAFRAHIGGFLMGMLLVGCDKVRGA